MNSMQQIPPFNCYWAGGYRTGGTPTALDQLPDYVNLVALAFAGLGKDSTLDLDYMLLNFSAAQLKECSAAARAKGQKVTMSIQVLEAEKVGGNWNDVDLPVLAKNAAQTVLEEWKLDGFDLDCEGEGLERIADFIPQLRSVIGPDPLVSVTVYTQSDAELKIITQNKEAISFLQTMAYWNDFDGMVAAAQWYADKIGDKRKVFIGVDVGYTPLDQCTRIARWTQENGFGGVMEWSIDKDNATYSTNPTWAWTAAIESGLRPPSSGAWTGISRLLAFIPHLGKLY